MKANGRFGSGNGVANVKKYLLRPKIASLVTFAVGDQRQLIARFFGVRPVSTKFGEPKLKPAVFRPSPVVKLFGSGIELMNPASVGSRPTPVGFPAMLYDAIHGALLGGVPLQFGSSAAPLPLTAAVEVPAGAFARPTT